MKKKKKNRWPAWASKKSIEIFTEMVKKIREYEKINGPIYPPKGDNHAILPTMQPTEEAPGRSNEQSSQLDSGTVRGPEQVPEVDGERDLG